MEGNLARPQVLDDGWGEFDPLADDTLVQDDARPDVGRGQFETAVVGKCRRDSLLGEVVAIAVFAAMSTGRIEFALAGDGEVALSERIVLHDQQVSGVLPDQPDPATIQGVNVSCQTAADLLGATQQFASEATKQGFLLGKVGIRNSEVALASVLKFQQQYVLPVELSKRFGRSKKASRLLLQAAGLEPVAQVNRVTIWNRSNVNQVTRGSGIHTA